MFDSLKSKWGKQLVLNEELRECTGGILNEYSFSSKTYKHTARLPKSIKIGKKVGYLIDDIVNWLNNQKIEIIEDNKMR